MADSVCVCVAAAVIVVVVILVIAVILVGVVSVVVWYSRFVLYACVYINVFTCVAFA